MTPAACPLPASAWPNCRNIKQTLYSMATLCHWLSNTQKITSYFNQRLLQYSFTWGHHSWATVYVARITHARSCRDGETPVQDTLQAWVTKTPRAWLILGSLLAARCWWPLEPGEDNCDGDLSQYLILFCPGTVPPPHAGPHLSHS